MFEFPMFHPEVHPPFRRDLHILHGTADGLQAVQWSHYIFVLSVLKALFVVVPNHS